MSIPLLPENAPFAPEQRAWLNGFFAGLLGLPSPETNGVDAVPLSTQGSAMPENMPSLLADENAHNTGEDFPWHDANLSLEERMTLAQEKPHALQLMAAMAQLDCGNCGYTCRTYAAAIADGSEKSLSKCSPGGRETLQKLKQLQAAAPSPAPAIKTASVSTRENAPPELVTPIPPAYDRHHPFPSALLEIVPLTRKDSEKDVRFVSLDLRGSGLTYEAGDALGVYPENDRELVEALLENLEITGEEPVATPEGFVVPARIALAKAYAINSCNEDFLATLSRFAADPDEAGRLMALSQDDPDDILRGRDVLDALEMFPSARAKNRAELNELLSSLAQLRPRLYSISSSPQMHPEEVHLTVAAVNFSLDGAARLRKGVASTFLTERARVSEKVGVFVQKAHAFRPPQNPDAPMIMVGPGTGIAPFRAFLQERKATEARGKNWLFFGDQRRDCDFLYRDELSEYSESGLLARLDTAFSRDQDEKIYVQHKMLEHAAELWSWLQEGAHFYVCGDAQRMARDVDAALQNIVAEQGGMDTVSAKAFVAEMSRSGRYQRDVY